jgi:spore germination protein YaaH
MKTTRQPDKRPMFRIGLRIVLSTLLLATASCEAASDDAGSSIESDTTEIPGPEPEGTGSLPPSQTPPSADVAGIPHAATTTPSEPVEVVLSNTESLAADRGVTISISAAGNRLGSIDRSSPAATVIAPPGGLEFTYVAPDGAATEVAWIQTPVAGRVVVEQPWRRPAGSPPTPVAAAWQQNPDPTELRDQATRATSLDVFSPIWWYLADDGTVVGEAFPQYVEDIHALGKLIWPAIAGLDADRNHALLSDPVKRSQAAEQISNEAEAMGADGVNIDIEGFREADADGFTAFIAELAGLVHAWGGVVSYDLVPRTDTWDVTPKDLEYWSTAPQRRELAKLVDYTVLMSYDQFNSYRPAGPVAAPWWVEETLVYQLRYSDPHQVILGVPFYGRVWDPEALDDPRALPIHRIENLAETGTASRDDTHGLDRVDLPDGRFLYLEDSTLIADRLKLVDEYGLAGWAAWRLGLDSPSLWAALDAR